METEEKVRENRLRRMAARQGLQLKKSRRRDPRALDYGRYYLVAKRGLQDQRVHQSRTGLSIDEVEHLLTAE